MEVPHHLPLSSLDIWRRIAANPTIAAHALLRLELTTEQMTNFLCRLREELGCALELVAVSVWKQGIRQLMQLWTERLGEEEIALSVVSKRLDLIKQHVPAIRLILYFMRFQNGFGTVFRSAGQLDNSINATGTALLGNSGRVMIFRKPCYYAIMLKMNGRNPVFF